MAAPPPSAAAPISSSSDSNKMQQQQQWYPDERDSLISWLRGEFAAANAVIDALLHHLRVTGEPGEYDHLAASVQQRRCNWSPILHMQHYFSIADVIFALQQATWRKQQQQLQAPPKVVAVASASASPVGEKDGRRQGFGYRPVQRFDSFRRNNHSPPAVATDAEKGGDLKGDGPGRDSNVLREKEGLGDCGVKSGANSTGIESRKAEHAGVEDCHNSESTGLSRSLKCFSAPEALDDHILPFSTGALLGDDRGGAILIPEGYTCLNLMQTIIASHMHQAHLMDTIAQVNSNQQNKSPIHHSSHTSFFR